MSVNATGKTSILKTTSAAKVAFVLLIVAVILCGVFYVLPRVNTLSLTLGGPGGSLPSTKLDFSILQKIIGAGIIVILLWCIGLIFNLSKQLNQSITRCHVAEASLKKLNIKHAQLAQQITKQEQRHEDLEYSMGERNLELEITLRELSEKNAELQKLSAIDTLTGLMNRRFFDKQIIAECRRSRRELTPLSIAMLDIDFFKKINDNYGHLGGDHCLQAFAKVLKETFKRPSDIISRYGGEEFVLILPNTSQEGLQFVLEKVRQNVEKEIIMFEGNKIPITVSIGGYSKIVNTNDDKDSLVAKADKHLYHAKETGRNRVVVTLE